MSKYFKKQKKTRTIFLNTDEASYVDSDRKTFNFYIPPINIEDESMLSVKNTILDYRSAGLSVKDVELPYISTTGISTGYNAPPDIIFTPQDGKGTGATAVGILQPVPLSTSATSSSTALGVVSGGSGYAGLGSEYISTITAPASGGTGASILPTINTSTSTLPTAITSTPVASGTGTIGTSDRHITFAYYGTGATGDYSFTTTEELLCDILVVAGGGGGGEKYGGGGGGGAFYYAQNVFLPAGNYIARVGKGGVPVAIAENAGAGAGAGSPSSLSFNGTNIIYMRGGAGGASGGLNTYGAFGGSGSGGAGPAGIGQNAGSGTNIPAGTYGNKGGNAIQIAGVANTICGGGGGGAGGAGGDAFIDPNGTQTRAGAGGTGLVVNLTGTSSTFCGGGGGGATTNGSFAGTAGAGGGGAGGSGTAGTSGTNNLGGGGGGGGWTGTTAFAGGSGGSGYVVIKYTRNINRNGNITSAVLTAGSGYVDLPVINTPTPVSEPATFGTFAYSTTNGNITAVPAVLNPTTNGFYNASTFKIGFVNNPVQLQGFCQTDGAGTITWITISNSGNNGYYRITAPPVILAINGVLLGSGFGVGLQYDFTYSAGRATACSVINGGSGYGNNLVDAPVLFSAPAIPTTATILSKEIVNGRLQSLVMGAGGSRYYKPSIEISAGLVAPVPALYNPIYLRPAQLRGVRMLTNGSGYTKPPLVGISTATKTPSLNGDMPLIAEMTQTHLVEPNNVYTIKAEGFNFNRTSYSNTDYKGRPTIAMCSPNEMMNDEEYSKLILPAQVINNLSLTITDRDGEGLDANKNLIIVIDIEELDQKDTKFEESKRQEY